MIEQRTKCPKCGSYHGNDWSQCGGDCPMPMSPYYKALSAHPSTPTDTEKAAS